ncbi:CAP domain-containing protein [Arthrobacter sp. FW306-2-2C-D06B]|uniref:CAP domain-containing protein n=1 Tax=Arthrobacter sp. FW306-2-2C-D06B TaxID=2879618 RepID=UPI001F1A9D52|nr:CAP domain-containing protein [Arthrobacter sp. FW306-2-2C-D06B]UKA57674.1 CAP domain-containing protein [Arthrobacter sp. FW306-2-2C-D06B]
MKSRSTRISAVTLGLLLSLSGGLIGATASTAAPVPAAVPSSVYSDAFAKTTLDLMNAERAKVGARPLAWNQRIADVSQDWANHLGVATMDPAFEFATIHRTDAGGSLIPADASMYREIIGFNFTPEQIVGWWINSPSHKAAMLDPRLTDVGLGYVVPTSGPYQGWHLVVSNLAAYPMTSPPAAPASKSPIGAKAASYNGSIGTATSPEVSGLKSGGSFQCYQVGCILYSPASGAHLTMGAIRSKWAETGFENGRLGYPVTDEVPGLRNRGVYQNYQNGAIIWSPATGAHISLGGIRTAWAATGFENGRLGYPVTDEVPGLRKGGVYQNYQNGAIIWSPATGGFVSFGGTRTIWGSTGFENGRLGYPTSNEYATGPGGAVAQNYEGGVIHWTPTGWWVTYI